MPEIIAYHDLKERQAQSCKMRYLDAGEAEFSAVLIDVGECRVRNGYEQFALLFRVAGSGAPRQGTYAVTLPGLSVQEWFLVPVGQNSEGMLYEATFNRLAPAAP